MDDKFSEVMQSNLHERGVHLHGLAACRSLETQKERFNDAGFARVGTWTMQEIYAQHFNPLDIQRFVSYIVFSFIWTTT